MINQVMQGPDWDSSADLPHLGRVGWLLRPRRAADDRRQRAGHPGAEHPDQPVREAGLHRPRRSTASTRTRSSSRTSSSAASGSTPTTDGRPDPRPVVRENAPQLADLDVRLRLHATTARAGADRQHDANAINPPVHPTSGDDPRVDVVQRRPRRRRRRSRRSSTAGARAGRDRRRGAAIGAAPFNAVLKHRHRRRARPITHWTMRLRRQDEQIGNRQAGRRHAHLHGAGDVSREPARLRRTRIVDRHLDRRPSRRRRRTSGSVGTNRSASTRSRRRSTRRRAARATGRSASATARPNATGTGLPQKKLIHTLHARRHLHDDAHRHRSEVGPLERAPRAISTVSASRAPTAQTKAPDIGPGSAHLGADLWTNGKATTFHFEWGTEPNTSRNITPDAQRGQLGASSPAQAISGLCAGTKYYFRIVATNAVGTTHRHDALVHAEHRARRSSASSAVQHHGDSVTLNGTINTSRLRHAGVVAVRHRHVARPADRAAGHRLGEGQADDQHRRSPGCCRRPRTRTASSVRTASVRPRRRSQTFTTAARPAIVTQVRAGSGAPLGNAMVITVARLDGTPGDDHTPMRAGLAHDPARSGSRSSTRRMSPSECASSLRARVPRRPVTLDDGVGSEMQPGAGGRATRSIRARSAFSPMAPGRRAVNSRRASSMCSCRVDQVDRRRFRLCSGPRGTDRGKRSRPMWQRPRDRGSPISQVDARRPSSRLSARHTAATASHSSVPCRGPRDAKSTGDMKPRHSASGASIDAPMPRRRRRTTKAASSRT